jgi:DNA polymerase delta subunit 1
MIRFGLSELAPTMDLARDAARFISEAFIKPIKLEFEKVYFPYLLISKKRYAGLLWTKPTQFDKIDCKGIESVRRDNCRLVKELIEDSLQQILVKRDVNSAITHIKDAVRDLRQNKVDLSLLVISKTISKDSYKAKQPHTELALRLKKRDPATAPGIGDRVPYVIVRGTSGAPVYERSEDPLYVLEHNVPVDTTYYLDQQLKKPLKRLFKAILPDTNTLFVGDHTRTMSIVSSKTLGIGSFAVRGESCLGCRVALEDGQKTLCDHCRPHAAIHYSKKLELLRHHEKDFQVLWTQCQACQGSVHERVICENSDCPIFYRRTRAAFDLKEAAETLERFSLDW